MERQPCRLPSGTSGVDSRSFAPKSCQGKPSNVPPEVLPPAGFANNSSEGSLGISVLPSAHKHVRFALTSVRQTFDPNSSLGEGPIGGEHNSFPTVPNNESIKKKSSFNFFFSNIALYCIP